MAYIKKPERYQKLRQDFIDKNSEKWGEYELLGEYHNKDTKTLFRHSCGNEFSMTPHNFSAGHGCPMCAKREKAEKLKQQKGNKFLDIIKQSNGEYELVSEYKNISTAVTVKHNKCGRTFSRLPSTVYLPSFNGCLCKWCNMESLSNRYQHSLDSANSRLSAVNSEFEFITYHGAKNLALIRHKKCKHEFEQKAAYFISGDGHCPKCTTHISKEERGVYDWVKSVCPTAIQSNKKVLGGPEIDVYIPDKNVGIEFNGHYWHSAQVMMKSEGEMGGRGFTYAEAKRFHRDKSLACEKRGIRLIHIWDYEWEDERKQAVLKNIILGAVQKLPRRFYARQCDVHTCKIGEPRWKEYNEFFEQNNIQGNRGGNLVYSLEKDGEILMAYKFGRPSGGIAKKKYQYEMVRGASAPGVQVIGGATKLWKHFINDVDPESVVYYIDYNYFNGNSVEKIGLKCVGGQPGVKNYWVKDKNVKNREPRRHAEVKKAIENGECLEMWNAGTKTYEYRKDSL